MKLVDLNILLYAVNVDAPHHGRVVAWWERALTGDETIGFAWPVVVGFLRVSTNPRIFPAPLTSEAAVEQIDAWLALDVVSVITETRDHWRTLRSLVAEAGVAGNLAADAHLAALAVTHGATLASCDADFARFEGLRWENPLRRTE
ncbi:MAG: PIN domain-containing protein [Acidobacteria bacterium]|nr:PIN domain-containing protein [Acidobacteriota bacterium]